MPLNLEQTFTDLTQSLTDEQKVVAARAILKDTKHVVISTVPVPLKGKSRMRGAA